MAGFGANITGWPAFVKRGHLFGDTLLVSGFTVTAKLVGALKTAVLANLLGPGIVLDSYLLAFLIPSFLGEVFLAALVPALVPRLAELRHNGDLDSRNGLYADLFRRALRYSAGVAAVLALIALAGSFAPGRKMRMSADALLWMAPLLLFSACSNIWRAVLAAERRFAAIAISPCLSPAVIMACVVVPIAGPISSRLAFGTLLGAILESAALAIAVSRAGCPVIPWNPRRRLARPIYSQYGFLVMGSFASSGAIFIDQCMAAFWGSGGLSIYTFGTRFPNLLLATGPSALSTTVLPHLSDSVARRGTQPMKSLLRRVLVWSGVAGAITSVALIACSSLIIRATMQHGLFTAADTDIVARVQSWSIAQLPFAMCIAALTRAIASTGGNGVLAPVAGFTIISTVVLDYVLMRWMGVAGVALSRTIVLAITAAALGVRIFQRAPVARVVRAAA